MVYTLSDLLKYLYLKLKHTIIHHLLRAVSEKQKIRRCDVVLSSLRHRQEKYIMLQKYGVYMEHGTILCWWHAILCTSGQPSTCIEAILQLLQFKHT